MPSRPSIGPSQAPLTPPCLPSNHTITLNLTLTFAASWFGHASHVDWVEQDPPNFVHGCLFILHPHTNSDPSLGSELGLGLGLGLGVGVGLGWGGH